MATVPIIQYPISIAKGGTGATTMSAARLALTAAASGANSDITSLSGLTTPLPVTEGGTGSTTSAAARLALTAAASGANSDITSLSGLTTALSVAQGGTGATAAGPTAAHNIGAAASGANSDITSLSGLTTALSVAQGGTGANTASAARTNLGAVASSSIGVANGVAGLDSGGKIPLAQLPSVLMEYLGAWNASTNTPTLADGTGIAGSVYRVSVAGSCNTGSGSQTFYVGDFIIYSGTAWQRSPAADGVISVNGSTGAVTLTPSTIGAAASGANSDITSLSGLTTPLPVTEGGTGSTTVSAARAALAAAASGANSDITSLSGLTTALPVTEGGSGATTAAAAATAYGLGTGSNVQFNTLGVGTAPAGGVSLAVNQAASPTVVNAAWQNISSSLYANTTTGGSYNHTLFNFNLSEVVATGQSNANYSMVMYGTAYRGNYSALDDSGSGAKLAVIYGYVGHTNSRVVCSPITTTAYGICLNPVSLRGYIGTLYGLYLAAPQTLVAPSTWVLNTVYPLNTMVKPSTGNGYYFVCTTAGTSGATEPSWTASPGGTTADGAGALVWTAIMVPTIANEYGVYSASTTGKNYFAGVTQFAAHVGIGAASTTTSPLHVSGLPTSSTGLVSGDVWNNGGVLTIVP